ncbi:hypothetical protein [Treponema sp.]|uniref:hypothetical protein n=1 Tax=Treponema sp. TaxID=166 RepID=UPI003F08D4AB
MKKKCLFFPLLLLFFSSVSADYNRFLIPDSAEIRRTIVDSWISAPISEVRGYSEDLRKNRVGEIFQIRMEETETEFAVIVAPRSVLDVDLINGDNHRIVRAAVYPQGAAGSWVLFRDKKSGKPLRVEWHFSPDSDVFLVFRPQGQKTLVDMSIFGSFAARSVPLGIPFERIYTVGFQEVRDLTQKTLPWEKVSVEKGLYRDSLIMAGIIKENLDSIIFSEDACYDFDGKLKSILTGGSYVLKNSSGFEIKPDEKKLYLSGAGFLKWIIDGIVEPVSGMGTKIPDLTVPTVEFDSVGKIGVKSQDWNLYFTLDWCRNLASKAYSVRSRRNADFKSAGLDVNQNHFASESLGAKVASSNGYIRNTGYSVEKIKSVLYVLAVTEPSWFYLGAVRQGSYLKPDEFVFNDCAVFFPYFDSNGKFGCFIFEQGREISLANFIERYRNCYVHLERVKASEAFFPYEKK